MVNVAALDYSDATLGTRTGNSAHNLYLHSSYWPTVRGIHRIAPTYTDIYCHIVRGTITYEVQRKVRERE